jgi:hypothetical protein
MDKGRTAGIKYLLMLLPICLLMYLADAGIVGAGLPTSAEAGVVSMRVLWTVSGYCVGGHSTWGEPEAKGFLFKPLDISRDAITFDGQVCKGVQFQKEIVATTDYLRSVWQVSPRELGIEDPEIQVVKTNCRIAGFQEYLRLSDNRLLVQINGVFFFFEPQVTR